MKKVLLFSSVIILTSISMQSQSSILERNSNFKGATATLDSYKAIYQLDSNDPRIINKTIRNINNALEDPRLKNKLQIELVAFSGGTDAFLRDSAYEAELKELVIKGVTVVQCSNTLKERHLNRDQIYAFIAVVPSGNGELIIRQAEGWAIIKP
ncbi:DsrE family protein [Flavobacterium sp. 7A]|uniref:DsrE family protein n=1 Tax=Flavobacterium sp. 7A TaxID=2940571 RepID=UPI002226B496|nr:DsrE family protein [Flavobacterium sp. 7A]MCW2120900.1 intracellular sulfur oxidation DsrE/DsrF family protein [Flavobacterium sp. 7A]